MTAHITLTASTYGIVQASFWNMDTNTIKTAQDAIIDDLKALGASWACAIAPRQLYTATLADYVVGWFG